jgi:hypothetical protein
MSSKVCFIDVQKQMEPAEKQEFKRLTQENIKAGMEGIHAEAMALTHMRMQAEENAAYLRKQITSQLGDKIPKQKEAPKEEPVLKAEETPGNEPLKSAEAEPLGGSPAARKASAVDGVSAMVHDLAEKYLGPEGHKLVTDVSHVVRKLVGSLEFLHSLVNRITPHMPSAKKWHDALIQRETMKNHLEKKYEGVSQFANKLSTKDRLAVGDYMARASLDKEWGHQPKGLDRTVLIDPIQKEKFEKLNKGQQALVDALFRANDELSQVEQKQKLMKSNGAPGIFAAKGLLDGPYVHLDRKGGFIAVLKSAEYMAAEKAKNKKLLETMERDPKHTIVRAFDTPGQADRFVRENEKNYASADYSAKMPQLENHRTMDPQALDRLSSALKVDTTLSADAKQAMEKSIRSMYLSTLDANSARQAHQKRAGTSGWDEDVVATALKHGRAKAAYLANIQYGEAINDGFYGMLAEIKHPETGKRVGQDDFNMLAAHHVRSLEYKPSPLSDGVVTATSAWQLVTSLGYHLTNFTQPVMYSLPRLAADFGSGKYLTAWGHLQDGYKLMHSITDNKGMTIDLARVKDANLREALNHASDMQLLDVGMTEDLKHFDRFSTGYKAIDATSGVASSAIHKMRQVSSAVERWNRVSSATASYNMARAEGRTHAQAKDYMIEILRDTQGDFSHTAAPLILKALPKIVGQYRKFQIMTASYYVNAYQGAFHGASKTEREIGRRLLAFKLTHTALASGLLGLPLVNVAGMVYDAVTDGPDKLEDAVDTGDKTLNQLLYHGLPSSLGLDMSAKLGEQNTFSIAPYSKIDLTSKTGLATTAAGLLGPAVGLAGQMADGVGLVKQGDIYKGTEKFMPKGMASAMEGFRLANEGFTMKDGDLVVKPDDISYFGSLLTAASIPSTEVTHIKNQEFKQHDVLKYYADNSKELENKYTRAYKEKDTEAMADLRAKWMELQKSKDDQRKHFKVVPDALKYQPLSTMLDAPNKAANRERTGQMQYGG